MVAIVAIGTASCGFPDPPHHNVLLISIDTLRADHLGAYGYEKGTSPAIDALPISFPSSFPTARTLSELASFPGSPLRILKAENSLLIS